MRTSTAILLGILGASVVAFLYSRTRNGAAAVESASSAIGRASIAVGDFVGFTNRGMRDNNPANIRRTSEAWVGELSRADVEAAGATYDPDFEQFSSIRYGVRALGRLLQTYSTKYALNTVRGIVSRFAPPSENDTEDYIAEVSGVLGVQDKERIDVYSRLPELAAAIMRRETSYVGDPAEVTSWVYS